MLNCLNDEYVESAAQALSSSNVSIEILALSIKERPERVKAFIEMAEHREYHFNDELLLKMLNVAGIDWKTLTPIKDEKHAGVKPKNASVSPEDQPFFMVYAEGESAPTYKHETYLQAHEEASRLAKKLACTTYVLTATTKFHHSITTENFAEVDRDELPF